MSCDEPIGEICLKSGERYSIRVDYTDADALPVGESVVSGVVTAWNLSTDEDATSVVLDGTPTVTVGTDTADFFIKYGVADNDYEIRLIVTTTNTHTIRSDIRLKSL